MKFGVHKGTDNYGNRYYEDLDLPYGQHGWGEYSDIHNPDPVLITPDWHGWMHHVFDETPDEMRVLEARGLNGKLAGQFDIGDRVDSDAHFTTHSGKVEDATKEFPHHDLTQYRRRGYNVGSLISTAEQGDLYYKQPGHPLYKKPEGSDEGNGRFEVNYSYYVICCILYIILYIITVYTNVNCVYVTLFITVYNYISIYLYIIY